MLRERPAAAWIFVALVVTSASIGVVGVFTLHFEMIRRCVVDNSASCTVVDSGGTAYPAIAFVIAGIVLSAYGLGKRSVRGGE